MRLGLTLAAVLCIASIASADVAPPPAWFTGIEWNYIGDSANGDHVWQMWFCVDDPTKSIRGFDGSEMQGGGIVSEGTDLYQEWFAPGNPLFSTPTADTAAGFGSPLETHFMFDGPTLLSTIAPNEDNTTADPSGNGYGNYLTGQFDLFGTGGGTEWVDTPGGRKGQLWAHVAVRPDAVGYTVDPLATPNLLSDGTDSEAGVRVAAAIAGGGQQFNVVGQLIPEPASMILLGLGGIGLVLRRRRS